MKKKETFWFIGTIIFVIVLFFGPSGFKNFNLSGNVDINVHDTYLVFPTIHLFILISTLTFFGVYLIRMLRRNFKNRSANLIFMISDITLILIFTFLISMVNSIQVIPSTTEYPPLSGEIVENTKNGWHNTFNILLGIQLILIILLAVCGIKTGRNHKHSD